MITVTLQFPTDDLQEILLAGTPRIGDHIRLRSTEPGKSRDLIVEQVTWVEGSGRGKDPDILVSVREYPSRPR